MEPVHFGWLFFYKQGAPMELGLLPSQNCEAAFACLHVKLLPGQGA